jgi:hypothetical protein
MLRRRRSESRRSEAPLPRTILSSMARTCPACGATNTVVAATTEIRPAWRINCSRCGAAIGATDGQQRQGATPTGPTGHGPSEAAGPAMRPPAAAARRAGPRRRRSALSRCCSGLHMAAGATLGILCTALLLDFGADPASPRKAATDAVVLAAALEAPASGPRTRAPAVLTEDRATPARMVSIPPDTKGYEMGTARAEPLGRIGLDRDPRLAERDSRRTLVDPKAAAAAEAGLDLSRRQRRELQRRLALAAHDPRLVDGIFGPATRAAITGWQIAAGLPPTGYLDTQAVALLEGQTEDRYREWRQAERSRDRSRQRMQTAAVSSPMPSATPAGAGRCQRTRSGEIAYGQNVLCDFRGLRENVAQLLRFERS